MPPPWQVFSGHHGPVTAGCFTPDGKAVVSVGGGEDCSLRVWNPKSAECTITIRDPHLFHPAGAQRTTPLHTPHTLYHAAPHHITTQHNHTTL